MLDDLSLVVSDDDGDARRRAHSNQTYHLRLHVWKFTGDFFAMVSDHAPFKLMAPYSHMIASEHELILNYCDLHKNDEVCRYQ